MDKNTIPDVEAIYENLRAVKGDNFTKFVMLVGESKSALDMVAAAQRLPEALPLAHTMIADTVGRMLAMIAHAHGISEADSQSAIEWSKRIADRFYRP